MTISQEHTGLHVPVTDDDVTIGPFRTLRLGADDWLIHDSRYPDNDARHLIACLRRRGSSRIEAVWLCGATLPTRHTSVRGAIECVAVWSQHHPADA